MNYKERAAKINWGFYYALKGHIVQSQGDHLDRVHSDQMVLKMIRRGDWSLLLETKSLKTTSRKTIRFGPLRSDGSHDSQEGGWLM